MRLVTFLHDGVDAALKVDHLLAILWSTFNYLEESEFVNSELVPTIMLWIRFELLVITHAGLSESNQEATFLGLTDQLILS